MKIECELFKKAYDLCELKSATYTLSESCIEWLNEIHTSRELISFFTEFSFSSFVKFGKVTFNSPNELQSVNMEVENGRLLENGFLIVGSGLNGDPIVVRMANGSVGYVCHDELWEGDAGEISAIYKRVSDSVGQFFYDAITKPNFPVDFYEASNS